MSLLRLHQAVMGQGGGGGPTDPYWANVVSLLHFDGSNGSTTFADQKGKTWSSVNGAQLTTSVSKFGTASLTLAAAGSYASTLGSADFNFGTGDFTVEGWYQFTSTARQYIYSNNSNSAAILITPSSGLLEVYGPSSHVINAGSTPLSTGAWYFLSLSRNGNTWRFFVDGVVYQSVTDSRSWGSSSGGVQLAVGGGSRYSGYIDDFRVTKGVGRYTSNFTPPAAAFPNS